MSKARNPMSWLVEANQLTADGRDWLTCAMDPFHDMDHQVAGYPDADGSKTVVSCYQVAYDIARPFNVDAGNNWDCHVFNLPTAQPTVTLVGADNHNGQLTVAAAGVRATYGLMNVSTNYTGAPLFANTTTAAANPNYRNINIQTPAGICDGSTRIVGMAFEVVNTTAEIEKQGTITAYRMPQLSNPSDVTINESGAANARGQLRVQAYQQPPSSPAEATNLIGTKQWAAAEGSYSTVTQCSIVNPISFETHQAMMLTSSDLTNGTTVLVGQYVFNGTQNAPPAMTPLNTEQNKLVPLNTSGVFLTGLSSGTTLRLKVKVYVEAAPTWANPQLAVLATPSAAYDVHALELYSKAMNILPVAVPVGENAAGDWWRKVLKVVSVIAAPLGMAVGLPGAGAFGSGIANAARVALESARAPKAYKKAQAATFGDVLSDIRGKGQSRPKANNQSAEVKALPQQGKQANAEKRKAKRAKAKKRTALVPAQQLQRMLRSFESAQL
jgi:hypothetical protein